MKKIQAVLLVLVGCAAVSASANPYGYYPPAQRGAPAAGAVAPATETPAHILSQGIGRLSRFLPAKGKVSEDEMRTFLAREVAPYFDFGLMARRAIGPTYDRMTDGQRLRFSNKLSDQFLGALARNLGTYSRPLPRIDIGRTIQGRWPNEAQVRVRVSPQRGYPMRLSFRFYRGRDGWKIFDVSANGTSAVAYYRRSLNSLMRRYGPNAITR